MVPTYVLLTILFKGFIVGAQNIYLNSSVDVSSGKALCPNTSVEFTCVATGVGFLDWHVNDDKIVDFTAGDRPSPSEMVIGPYEVFLDIVTIIPMTPTANITSRLVVNVTHLMTGNISCSDINRQSSVNINYKLRGPPQAVSDYSTSLDKASTTTLSLTFTWDSSFNSAHAITSYRVAPITASRGSSVTKCPPSCPPNLPCQCTGLPIGERVNLNISAVNCGEQLGPVSLITVLSSCRASDLGDIANSTDSRCGSSLSSVSIANGVGCYNATSSGSEVTYQCGEGYSLSGESHQTCQSNGAWSGSIPVCAEYFSSITVSRATIGLLVCTVLLLVTSFIMTIIGPVVMIIRKVSIQCWHTIYFVLLGIEGFLLLLVLLLLIAFGVVTTNPNRVASSLIAAFAFSVFAFVWIVNLIRFIHVKTAMNNKSLQNAGTFINSEGQEQAINELPDVHIRDPKPFEDGEVQYSTLQRIELQAKGISVPRTNSAEYNKLEPQPNAPSNAPLLDTNSNNCNSKEIVDASFE